MTPDMLHDILLGLTKRLIELLGKLIEKFGRSRAASLKRSLNVM